MLSTLKTKYTYTEKAKYKFCRNESQTSVVNLKCQTAGLQVQHHGESVRDREVRSGVWPSCADNCQRACQINRVASAVDIIDQLLTTFKICLCTMYIENLLDYPSQLR